MHSEKVNRCSLGQRSQSKYRDQRRKAKKSRHQSLHAGVALCALVAFHHHCGVFSKNLKWVLDVPPWVQCATTACTFCSRVPQADTVIKGRWKKCLPMSKSAWTHMQTCTGHSLVTPSHFCSTGSPASQVFPPTIQLLSE